jgi:hypothetical protein
VDAATKAGLLALLEDAVDQGWTVRAACAALELTDRRAWRWLDRRASDRLEDLRPGGGAVHGLLAEEVAEIVELFHQWGEVDRSHRKLAHRGSYLERVWVSPATVRRVLLAEGLRLRPLPRPARSVRQPFPDWVEYRPGMLWIFDTTHFTRAELASVREQYNSVRLHAGIGYVTPNDEHEGRGEQIRKARQAGLEQARLRRIAYHRANPTTTPPPTPEHDLSQEPGDVG